MIKSSNFLCKSKVAWVKIKSSDFHIDVNKTVDINRKPVVCVFKITSEPLVFKLLKLRHPSLKWPCFGAFQWLFCWWRWWRHRRRPCSATWSPVSGNTSSRKLIVSSSSARESTSKSSWTSIAQEKWLSLMTKYVWLSAFKAHWKFFSQCASWFEF